MMKKDFNDKKIEKMLSDIVLELDYVMWKELFDPHSIEDMSYKKAKINDLIYTVKKHIN